MTAPDAAAREAMQRTLINSCGTRCDSKDEWYLYAQDVADFILARQREREGPLVDTMSSALARFPFAVWADSVRETLARHAALDAPPPRTVEQIAADVVAVKVGNRNATYVPNELVDEMADALARRKEQG